MPPKPFPFPFSVGVDACQFTRVLSFMKDGDHLNSWARKVFTRLEWSLLYQKVNMAYEHRWGQSSSKTRSEAKLYLPNVSEQIPLDLNGRPDSHLITPPIRNLARFLAGRWAAKEAAIKAHRHRKLYYRDISIVQTVTPPDRMSDLNLSSRHKPFILIEPMPPYVVMDSQIAVSRGIRGFSPERPDEALPVGSSVSGQLVDGNFIPGRGPGMKEFVLRKGLVKMDDRQMAELSISHDGSYVIAVCMALDEEAKDSESPPYLADNGSGDPIHEPIWGDRGWLNE